MPGRSRRSTAALALLVSYAVAGCALDGGPDDAPRTTTASPTAEPSTPGSDRVLSFDFDDLAEVGALRSGTVPLLNDGAEPVTVRVSALAGGTLRSVPDRQGGTAARFPVHTTGPQRVVVTASSDNVTDPLAPGTSDFSFGADFTLDRVSEGGELDNGNNLLQRGLSGDPAQYKVQIDGRRASCVVVGDQGTVVVKAEELVEPEKWYRLTCTRTGQEIALELGTFDGPPERAVAIGVTGAVYVDSVTPLVIGGKATREGAAVASDADQFNGAVDNVFLQVEETR